MSVEPPPPATSHSAPPAESRATWTGEDVVRDLSLAGLRVVVTGASCGLGLETARCLAQAGAEVTLAVRSLESGSTAVRSIREQCPTARVSVGVLDLADLESVAAFSDSWRGPLDVLVANAGVMGVPERSVSPQGSEVHFAVNVLGHHLLLDGLLDALRAAGRARVVTLSSVAHRAAPVVFDDVDFLRRPYDRAAAYAQSKTATSLLAVAAAERWAEHGITANTLHPGAIWTSLQRHTGTMGTPVERRKSVAQGAATSVFLAAAPEAARVTGRYFEDCAPVPVYTEAPGYFDPGVMHWAVDPEQATALWELAEARTARWRRHRRAPSR